MSTIYDFVLTWVFGLIISSAIFFVCLISSNSFCVSFICYDIKNQHVKMDYISLGTNFSFSFFFFFTLVPDYIRNKGLIEKMWKIKEKLRYYIYISPTGSMHSQPFLLYTHNIISLLVCFFLTFNLCIFPLYILLI